MIQIEEVRSSKAWPGRGKRNKDDIFLVQHVHRRVQNICTFVHTRSKIPHVCTYKYCSTHSISTCISLQSIYYLTFVIVHLHLFEVEQYH